MREAKVEAVSRKGTQHALALSARKTEENRV
jgi:hypothetical protein